MNHKGKSETVSGLSLARSPLTLTLSPREREQGEGIFDYASDSLIYSAHRTSSKSAERFPLSSEERAGVRRSFN